ncbi:MAG: glycosyltransferase family 4 protein [Pseudomonadales bacterium]|nr:glycosyltransferase family 4 protein [Pseudomonadales bacterium]
MKLAFVLFSYFPYGGLQRDLMRLLAACREAGDQVSVYAMQWQGERPQGVEINLFPGTAFSRTGKRKSFVAYVLAQKEAKKPDALIGFNKMPGLDYYYAADSCFAEKAYEQRNFFYRLAPRSRQYLEFEKQVFDEPGRTRIFFIAPGQKNSFQSYYRLAPERCIELPPGIEKNRRADESAQTLRNDCRRDFGFSEQEFVILQIGSGFAIKGVDRSLRAIAALPVELREKTRFMLVGQDKPAPYLKLAKKLGIADKLSIHPGRDDIPRLLQGADMLLHPAYRESAGMVILEAIVAGLPVLATDTCGYAFHVTQAGAGLVCASPFKQARLDEMLETMLNSRERSRWREQGIAYGRREDLYDMPARVVEIIHGDHQARHESQ